MSIWDFKELKTNAKDTDNLVTLHEGNTPTQSIKIDGVEVILKREDKNPTGSWKDRATAYKLTKFLNNDIHQGVIFTSGNTAISYLTYIKKLKLDFKLHVVVSSNVNKDKLILLRELVSDTENEIYVEDNPKMRSVQLSAKLKIPNLKASVDDDLIESYWTIGFELMQFLNKQESNQDIGVFVPTSSGTGFVGVSQGIFIRLSNEYLLPKFFACQTTKVHPFYDHLNSVEMPTKDSLADAIIDTSGLRAPQVLKIIKESSGDALNIDDDLILEAEKQLKAQGVEGLSYNSLLSVAGFLQAKDLYNFNKAICIATGR